MNTLTLKNTLAVTQQKSSTHSTDIYGYLFKGRSVISDKSLLARGDYRKTDVTETFSSDHVVQIRALLKFGVYHYMVQYVLRERELFLQVEKPFHSDIHQSREEYTITSSISC